MRNLTVKLAGYAAYHRDRRNVATHFVGIPMIVVGLAAFGARPVATVAGLAVTPALVVTLGAVGFYVALDRRYGVAMAALTSLALWAGASIGALSTTAWLLASSGLFVAGWAIQLVGHVFEGRKPAFVDDLVGLLIGPLFLVAEAGFALGLRTEVREAIEARTGPTRVRAGSTTRPAPAPPGR